jgi:hypothetical protein
VGGVCPPDYPEGKHSEPEGKHNQKYRRVVQAPVSTFDTKVPFSIIDTYASFTDVSPFIQTVSEEGENCEY